MNIYISGSIAYDRIMDFPGKFSDHILPDKLHILNVCFTVNGMQEKFGGTAGNIAYSLALLGEKPLVMATIGKDFIPYFDWLKKNGISTDAIKIIESEFTAGAYITTDKADNQITGFNPGSMKHQCGYEMTAPPDDSIVLIAPGNLPDMIKYAKDCRAKKIPYICDPGQSLTAWDGKDLREWITGSKMLITNDYELELVMKMTGASKKELLAMTGIVITTLGEKGSLISSVSGDEDIPVAKVKDVVDPTGAGDAFRSGLLKGIASGKNLAISAKMGAVASAYAIEKYGTQEHAFTSAQFSERYEANFGKIV